MEQSIVDYVAWESMRWHEKDILTNIYKLRRTDRDNGGLTKVILSHWLTK
jgi:hypothetical protein